MVEKSAKSEGSTPAPGQAELPQITEISSQLITALCAKLDQFAAQLSPDEHITLATAFALAGRGFLALPGGVAYGRGLRVGIGPSTVHVERIAGTATPKLSEALTDTFCPGSANRYSIEGLEVERSMIGANVAGAKSVAAAGCRNPALFNPALSGAKSVAAAGCRMPGTFMF